MRGPFYIMDAWGVRNLGKRKATIMKALRTTLAAALAVAMLVPVAMQPAKADGAASTRNIILGAAALIAGFAISSNVAHKRQLASTIVGYLPDGSPVYADGHVVLPDGSTYYPGNYGQTISCNGTACYLSGGNGYSGYDGNGGYNGSNPYNTGAYNNGSYNGNGGYDTNSAYVADGRYNANARYNRHQQSRGRSNRGG